MSATESGFPGDFNIADSVENKDNEHVTKKSISQMKHFSDADFTVKTSTEHEGEAMAGDLLSYPVGGTGLLNAQGEDNVGETASNVKGKDVVGEESVWIPQDHNPDGREKTSENDSKENEQREGNKESAVPVQPAKSNIVCKHWRNGFCSFEDECTFRHSEPTPDTKAAAVPVQTEKSTAVCRHWMKGFCAMEDECKYAHSLEPPTVSASEGSLQCEPVIPEWATTSACAVMPKQQQGKQGGKKQKKKKKKIGSDQRPPEMMMQGTYSEEMVENITVYSSTGEVEIVSLATLDRQSSYSQMFDKACGTTSCVKAAPANNTDFLGRESASNAQSVYASNSQSVSAGNAQSVYASNSQSVSAGNARSVYASNSQSVSAGNAQNVYASNSQSVSAGNAQSGYASNSQSVSAGNAQSGYASNSQSVPGLYPENGHPATTRKPVGIAMQPAPPGTETVVIPARPPTPPGTEPIESPVPTCSKPMEPPVPPVPQPVQFPGMAGQSTLMFKGFGEEKNSQTVKAVNKEMYGEAWGSTSSVKATPTSSTESRTDLHTRNSQSVSASNSQSVTDLLAQKVSARIAHSACNSQSVMDLFAKCLSAGNAQSSQSVTDLSTGHPGITPTLPAKLNPTGYRTYEESVQQNHQQMHESSSSLPQPQMPQTSSNQHKEDDQKGYTVTFGAVQGATSGVNQSKAVPASNTESVSDLLTKLQKKIIGFANKHTPKPLAEQNPTANESPSPAQWQVRLTEYGSSDDHDQPNQQNEQLMHGYDEHIQQINSYYPHQFSQEDNLSIDKRDDRERKEERSRTHEKKDMGRELRHSPERRRTSSEKHKQSNERSRSPETDMGSPERHGRSPKRRESSAERVQRFLESLKRPSARQGRLRRSPDKRGRSPDRCRRSPKRLRRSSESPERLSRSHESPVGLRRSPESLIRAHERLRRSPEAFRRSPQRLGRSPERFRSSPEAFRRYPERFKSPERRGRSPDRLGRSPERLRRSDRYGRLRRSSESPDGLRWSPESPRRSPEILGRSPERFRRLPEAFRRSPERFSRSPEILGTSPERFRRSPERYRRSPERFRRSPEAFRRSPERFSRSPEILGRSPERFRRSPERYRRSPERFRRSPEAFRRSPERFRSPDGRGRSPERFRRSHESPEGLRRSPESLRRSPERFRRSPEAFRRSPERFSRSPEILGRSPERFRRSPERYRRSPERFRRSPEAFRRSPERFSRSPEILRRSPERLRRSPERFRRSPERYRRSPERFRRSPEAFRRSPERIGEIPDRLGRSPEAYDGHAQMNMQQMHGYDEQVLMNLHHIPDRLRRSTEIFRRSPERLRRSPGRLGRSPVQQNEQLMYIYDEPFQQNQQPVNVYDGHMQVNLQQMHGYDEQVQMNLQQIYDYDEQIQQMNDHYSHQFPSNLSKLQSNQIFSDQHKEYNREVRSERDDRRELRHSRERCRLSPERHKRSLETLRRSPERLRSSEEMRRSSKRLRKSPETLKRSPKRLKRSPERLCRSPERNKRSSERSRRSPERLHKSPQRQKVSSETRNRRRTERERQASDITKATAASSPDVNARAQTLKPQCESLVKDIGGEEHVKIFSSEVKSSKEQHVKIVSPKVKSSKPNSKSEIHLFKQPFVPPLGTGPSGSVSNTSVKRESKGRSKIPKTTICETPQLKEARKEAKIITEMIKTNKSKPRETKNSERQNQESTEVDYDDECFVSMIPGPSSLIKKEPPTRDEVLLENTPNTNEKMRPNLSQYDTASGQSRHDNERKALSLALTSGKTSKEFQKKIEDPRKPVLGQEISNFIANFIRTAGKSKQGVEIVEKKYHLPGNCIALIPPKMSDDVWDILKKPAQMRDGTLQDVQRWLSVGIIPVIQQINLLIEGEQEAKDVCQVANDSLTVLMYVLLSMSIKRRLLMRNSLNKKYAVLCRTSNNISDLLFGDNLAKDLKEVKLGVYQVEASQEDDDYVLSPNGKPTFSADLAVPGADVDINVAGMINLACVSEGDVEELRKKYKIPSNCDTLIPAKINPEMWSLLSRSGLELDCKLQDVQLSIAEATVPLMLLLQSVHEKKNETCEALRILTDALGLLCHAFFQMNKARKEAMLKTLPKTVQDLGHWYWQGAEQVSGTQEKKYLHRPV